jgi:hypothetical protein
MIAKHASERLAALYRLGGMAEGGWLRPPVRGICAVCGFRDGQTKEPRDAEP